MTDLRSRLDRIPTFRVGHIRAYRLAPRTFGAAQAMQTGGKG
jgi:hypothetical protein